MSGFCWLGGDPRTGGLPLIAAQYAQLLGVECRRWSRHEAMEAVPAPANRTMIALSYRALRSLGTDQAMRLRDLVEAGAILYVRGRFLGRELCSLAPIAEVSFSPIPCRPATEYRIEAHSVIPEVLHEEAATGRFQLPSAKQLTGNAEPLLSGQFEYGERAPVMFAIRCGAGVIICDLLPDKTRGSADEPIVDRLADPSKRYAELGALICARLAAGIDPTERPGLNLTMDDRPANFDYLNTNRLAQWLWHSSTEYPDVHIDFAWTPDQIYPPRSFVETLKRFNTGIVWHGFKHHLNHQDAQDLAGDLRDGIEMVKRLSSRFAIRFQPIMVFPFESFGLDALRLLEEQGFLATYAKEVAPVGLWSPYPSFMNCSVPLHEQFTEIFTVMRRWPLEALSRDVMLSHAALNLPTIAVLHPCDVGLRRWPYYPAARPDLTKFDSLLSFAATKRLRARSLQEMAEEAILRPRPVTFESMEMYRINAR